MLRGAARPGGHKLPACGNRFLPRAEGARRALDCAAWSLEWKLRDATRPDLYTALTSGKRLMPRAEGASSTPDWKLADARGALDG